MVGFRAALVPAFLTLPLLLAWQAASKDVVVSQEFIQRAEILVDGGGMAAMVSESELDTCQLALESLSFKDEPKGPFDKITFVVHRNGDPDPCEEFIPNVSVIRRVLRPFDDKCNSLNKYEVGSLLTQLVADQISTDQCGSTDNVTAPDGILGYCDMGAERTPKLHDHQNLVRVPSGSLPCRFYTREGVLIKSLNELATLARYAKQKTGTCNSNDNSSCESVTAELHLYAVPAGRVFMFAPAFVGETFELPHVQVDSGLPVSLEVLSLNPRVFDIKNFFSKVESDELIQRALAETSPTHKLKRSTTGAMVNTVYAQRTSENAFDTGGVTAVKIKHRCLTTLGFDEYFEGHTDGLQVLRYNESKAYVPHMDYLEDKDGKDPFDYDSSKRGGNRFATILLYMSDMGGHDGGETVFSEAYPPNVPESERVLFHQALEELRASGDAKMLAEGSWEETMVATCRSRLAVRPNSARAVLFYSQHPNGQLDLSSRHGGCPVLHGAKWAANLWVWNTPRSGYLGAPMKDNHEMQQQPKPKSQLFASFRNAGNDSIFKDAELYYEDTFWNKLGHGDPPQNVNTFAGHRWNIKVGGEVMKSFIINSDERQYYAI